MNLLSFIGRRAIQSLFVLLGLSIVIFTIARVMPGDPVRLAVGSRAPQWVVDNMREQMHLDDPLVVQYGYWLRDALTGDFGISLVTRRGVMQDLFEFFPASIEVALFSLVISVTGAISLGVISTRFKDTWIDNVLRVISYTGIVTPSFVFAIVFLLVFAFWLDWFPAIGRLSSSLEPPTRITGMYTVDALLTGNFEVFWDALHHLFLPSLALAMGSLAQEARLTRSSMSDNLNKDYIASARALGISEGLIMRRYLLKPSLIPVVSILGLDFAAGIGNAFLVELIFNWPGISRYGMNAMLSKDLNAISGVIISLGLIFIIVNIVVDIIVAQLDPRIRLRGN
ncbi:MAG: ABC transporter permease [Chloroflexota bacterium]